jgi:uncharacterized protein (DUF2235 family)
VVRLAERVAREDGAGMEQRVYYDTGVGTAGGHLRRIFDGATGTGLSANLLKAYHWLILNYEPGDEIFLFGFSRGAFTARSLGGLIRNSGVLTRRALHRERDAFALYRSRAPQAHPRARESALFRRSFSVEDVTPIHFLGVWDTVGALGNPLLAEGIGGRRNHFHDTDLSSSVRHAYQALAIDEKRVKFRPALWHQGKTGAAEGQVLEQVWFAGVHSNVGGGYPRTGLADLALDWMVLKAAAQGLSVEPLATRPDPTDEARESRKWMYLAFPPYHRPIALPSDDGPTRESLHPSVLERWQADETYRPRNLMYYFDRHPEARPAPAGIPLPHGIPAPGAYRQPSRH